MKKFFPGPLGDNARNIMRHLGYGEQRTRAGQISYTRRISGERFPRYHAYVEDRNGGLQINLHVDQKEASYEGTSAHAGEYEGSVVDREMNRIAELVAGLKNGASSPVHDSTSSTKKKKGFWGSLCI